MVYSNNLILIIVFVSSITLVPRGEAVQLSSTFTSTNHQQGQHKEIKTNMEVQSAETPITTIDLTDLDLSTPEKAVISFIQLYNNIIPITPKSDLELICIKFTNSSYREDCQKIFQSRLSQIKSIAINLEGAKFGLRPPVKLTTVPMVMKASWQEQLSFFDGLKKNSDKNMVITLEKSNDDWKVTNAEWE